MSAITYTFAAMKDDPIALSRGLRKRDPGVLEALIQQYQYRLFRYLVHISGSREIAEDVFQETWIRVLERGSQFDPRRSFDTWLFAIARHLVIDVQRRRLPERLEDLLESGDSVLLADSRPSPLEIASRAQLATSTQDWLATLPAAYREVLVLRFQEDLPLDEIARVVDAPLGTVKSRLYRGLELLRTRGRP